MKKIILLLVALVVLSSCTKTFDRQCLSMEVFGPVDHTCPQELHGPCPFCNDSDFAKK